MAKKNVTFADIAEYTGVSFNLVQEKIYSIKKFNKLLLKQLENTDSTKIDLKSIKYNDKKLIKNKEYIKFILEKICDKNETLIKEFISNTNEEVSKEYIEKINTEIYQKFSMSSLILDNDYYKKIGL